VRLLVVTRGASGAVAWTRKTRVEVPSMPATVVDTVGAGDRSGRPFAWLDERDLLNNVALGALEQAQVQDAVFLCGTGCRHHVLACGRRLAAPKRAAWVKFRSAAENASFLDV